MQVMLRQMSGFSTLFDINVDRLITAGLVVVGLFAGAFVGSYLPH